jgi:integral membrane protein
MRIVGSLECLSLILLMGVGMPLKYFAGMPVAVKWTGWIHGILFIAYCVTILLALTAGRISFLRSVMAFIAALFPFGPFILDRWLVDDERLEISGG